MFFPIVSGVSTLILLACYLYQERQAEKLLLELRSEKMLSEELGRVVRILSERIGGLNGKS